jgi:hypothetical protein
MYFSTPFTALSRGEPGRKLLGEIVKPRRYLATTNIGKSLTFPLTGHAAIGAVQTTGSPAFASSS